MNNPGAVPLGDFNITGADEQIGTPITGLAGMLSAALQALLAIGTPGTKIQTYFQTTLDQGQTWFDVACVAFTNTGGAQMCNVSALDKLTAWTTPTDGALADNTIIDGPLGDQLRVKVRSTGTYGGSTLLSCWAAMR